jgi:chaperone BCS1
LIDVKGRTLTNYAASEEALSVIDDLKEFLKNEEFYGSIGITWKRGYIFYGPPGNGKTTFIRVLATEFNKRVYSIDMNTIVDTAHFNSLLTAVSSDSIVIFEDFDCIYDRSSKRDEEHNKKFDITLTHLLQCFDGMNTREPMIFIMTTNNLDKFDPALIRPGRVDKLVNFKNATKLQAKKLYMMFFKDDSCGEKFIEQYRDYEMSLCAIQETLISNITDKNAAIDSFNKMLEHRRSIST